MAAKLTLGKMTAFCWSLAVVLGVPPCPLTTLGAQQEGADPSAVDAFLAAARQDVEKKISKDPALRALAAQYPLVLLHSRTRFAGGQYLKSAYSFIDETNDQMQQHNGAQLLFDNGGHEGTFDINLATDQSNLVADLGQVDFTKDPDPKAVDIDGEGQHTWLPGFCKAVEGDAYLVRVRDAGGNHFYVLFKVVAVEKDSRYMAIVWRKLPGGKVVKAKGDPEPPAKDR